MNNFLEEKEKLLNSIENNTSNHWKEYYKNVPLNCIFEDLVLDVNEIKRLTKENQQLKEQLQQKEDIINKAREYCDFGVREWITDDGFVEEVLRDIKKILDNKGE